MEKRDMFVAFFFLLGIFSILCQSAIFRELINAFYGNEFFSGLILGFWFLWVAFGSYFLGKFLKPSKNLLFLIFCLIPIFLFLEIFFLRISQNFIGLAGETPNLILAILISFFATSPVCILLGIFWTKSTQLFSEIEKVKLTVNLGYFFETLGFIFGGILFSFLLVYLFEFQIAFLILIFCLIFAFFLSQSLKKKIAIFFLILIFLVLIFPLKILEKKSLSFKFKNQKLVTFENSPYGKIVLTKTQNQYNFYENGMLLGSNKDFEAAEEIGNFALLAHPNPKRILLIGGGFGGILKEILKHPVEKVYYLEIDPKILKISKEFLPEFENLISERKIEIFGGDPRYFLIQNKEKFDLILLNISFSSTILTNRYFTQDFFKLAKENLKENGILFFNLPFSQSFANKNLEKLNSSILKAAKNVFENVYFLPGEKNFFFCGKSHFEFSPEILIKRKNERKIETKFINENYILYRFYFTDPKILFNSFVESDSKINQDFLPIAYFYYTLFWLDSFYPNFSKIFRKISFSFWQILIFALFFLIIFSLKKKQTLPIISVSISGFSLMAFETILIFLYQTFIGHLYFKIALLISVLMAGMAIGVFVGNKKEIGLSFLHFLIFSFSILLFFLSPTLKKFPLFLSQILILILAILAGVFGGLIFPTANKIYLSFQENPKEKTGIIYSSDLIGSFFGAFLPNLILIPVYGLKISLIFIALFNLFLSFFAKNLGSKNV